MCGATSGQQKIGNEQSNFYNQLTSQASSVFGQNSSVYNQLIGTFAPTVAAGPNQQGFSAQELASLNSQAITNTGQGYANAKQALGDQQAAAGGGRAVLPGGATVGQNDYLASSAANQQANELNQITQANYQVGRQNYTQAVQGLAGAGNVYGSSNQLAGTAIGAGNAAANTQNQIAQESNSWVNAVTGALGGVASAATGGIIGNLGQNPSSGPAANWAPSGYLAQTGNNLGLASDDQIGNAGFSPSSYVPAPSFGSGPASAGSYDSGD